MSRKHWIDEFFRRRLEQGRRRHTRVETRWAPHAAAGFRRPLAWTRRRERRHGQLQRGGDGTREVAAQGLGSGNLELLIQLFEMGVGRKDIVSRGDSTPQLIHDTTAEVDQLDSTHATKDRGGADLTWLQHLRCDEEGCTDETMDAEYRR